MTKPVTDRLIQVRPSLLSPCIPFCFKKGRGRRGILWVGGCHSFFVQLLFTSERTSCSFSDIVWPVKVEMPFSEGRERRRRHLVSWVMVWLFLRYTTMSSHVETLQNMYCAPLCTETLHGLVCLTWQAQILLLSSLLSYYLKLRVV